MPRLGQVFRPSCSMTQRAVATACNFQQGFLAHARILVGHGADVSAKDKNRSTLLYLASERGHNCHMVLAQFVIERIEHSTAQATPQNRR
jgi:ankyrin repeat protein